MGKALAAAVVVISLFAVESAARDRSRSLADRATAAAAREGRREAEQDIRDGRLILRSYGFASGAPLPQSVHRLGIRRQSVAGCVINPAIIAETAAYNEVMKAEIRRRFGAVALD